VHQSACHTYVREFVRSQVGEGGGCDFHSPIIQSIAAKYHVGAAQVCLRWVLQRGAVLTVGTGRHPATLARYSREDLDVFNFSLSRHEMNTLQKLERSGAEGGGWSSTAAGLCGMVHTLSCIAGQFFFGQVCTYCTAVPVQYARYPQSLGDLLSYGGHIY
jgi:hypothetical protein